MSLQNNSMKISIVVVFYNMRREARRTLYSMSAEYQKDVGETDYEVIAIDNNSEYPLDESRVTGFGNNFKYVYLENPVPSPSRAINYGVRLARYDHVMICIDGARILSPGMMKYMLLGLGLYPNPLVFSLGMHIGDKQQNFLVAQGYNQSVEDKLLRSIDWRRNGYLLFLVSAKAASATRGCFSYFNESNCFTIKKSEFMRIGGYDERFVSPGGGIVNHDFFKRTYENQDFKPVLILGEATFHQYHGGVATNVPMADLPFNKMKEEYYRIRGEEYTSNKRYPEYIGWYSDKYHKAIVGRQS